MADKYWDKQKLTLFKKIEKLLDKVLRVIDYLQNEEK